MEPMYLYSLHIAHKHYLRNLRIMELAQETKLEFPNIEHLGRVVISSINYVDTWLIQNFNSAAAERMK